MWIAISAVAVVGLIYFYRGPNAVWGGAMLGLIRGLIAEAIRLSSGSGFRYETIGRPVVAATVIGLIVEAIWRIARRTKSN